MGFEPEVSEWESCPARGDPKGSGTQGTKTFQYLQEEKSIEMRLVTASESRSGQTEFRSARCERCGVVGPHARFFIRESKLS